MRAVRTVTLIVCAAGIAGMIVTSIQGHNGAAVTFGLITAVAVVCSIVAKAVAAETEHRLSVAAGAPPASVSEAGADALAELVELQVQILVEGGAQEGEVRQLVGEAVRLGRTLGPTGPATTTSERTFASGAQVPSRRTPHAGNV